MGLLDGLYSSRVPSELTSSWEGLQLLMTVTSLFTNMAGNIPFLTRS